MRLSFNQTSSFALLMFIVGSLQTTFAQPSGNDNAAPPNKAVFCNRDNSRELISQQISGTRLIDDASKRIRILLRAADLLWAADVTLSRKAFKEAFDLADDEYQNQQTRGSARRNGLVDQRYKVIAAIAKRDRAWAANLLEQVTRKTDEADVSNEAENNPETSQKLLTAALSLISSDPSAAVNFAKSSLKYPATLYLSAFLYRLADMDQTLANQLYQEALQSYAGAPMNQFLYLSSYPFGNDREAGEMPSWTVYTVPASFKPVPNLQRLFAQTLLLRANQMIERETAPVSSSVLSDYDQAWIALTRLEPQIDRSLPDLVTAVAQARGTLFALNNQQGQQRLMNRTTDPPERTFADTIAEAGRSANSAAREQGIALAVLHSKNESLQEVVDAIQKIDDTDLRDKLLSWLYFNRAQQAVKDNDLEKAKNLASKVIDVDQRAYLYSTIAEQLIKQTKVDNQSRELLEEVLNTVAKAPNTEVKARALLGLAYVYNQIEPNRAMAILSDAVSCINHIESPDFANDYTERKIQGRTFASYAILQTPGFSPENVFREMSKVDPEGSLALASNLTDKSLRAMVTLSVVELCLANSTPVKQPQRQSPQKKPN